MGCSFVPRNDLASRFDSLVDELSRSGSACIVVDQGKPRAVLLDVGTYHAMMDTLESIESGGSADVDIKAIRALLKQKPNA